MAQAPELVQRPWSHTLLGFRVMRDAPLGASGQRLPTFAVPNSTRGLPCICFLSVVAFAKGL